MHTEQPATDIDSHAGGTQAASSERKPHYYRPELDVVRCLAFLLVFTLHALPRARTGAFSVQGAIQELCASGVCLFFTLSSFLITELLLREREATGAFRIKAFYVRRVLRIWPLYFAVLAIAVISPHVYSRFSRSEGFILPMLLMAGNWAFAAHGSWPKNPILNPLWSISVEEQFYVLWPTLFLLWRRRGIVTAIFFVLPIAWLTDLALPAWHFSKDPVLWVNSLSQFQFFALGGALALVTHRRRIGLTPLVRLSVIATAFGSLWLSAYPFHASNDAVQTSPLQVLCGYLALDLGCVLLLLGFLEMPLPRLCSPLVYLGRISYGLYLFHFFCLNLVQHFLEGRTLSPAFPRSTVAWLSGMVMVVPMAALSYEYFEKPFLRLKGRFTFVSTRLIELPDRDIENSGAGELVPDAAM